MKHWKIGVVNSGCAMLAAPLLLSQGSRNIDWPVYVSQDPLEGEILDRSVVLL